MKGKIVAALTVAAVMLWSPLNGIAAERVVNVFNWSDYIDPEVLKDFTKDTGIKVVYDTYDSNEALETKLLSGGSGYDIAVPTASPNMARQIKAGALLKLDKSKLTNLSNMWDFVANEVAAVDPGNQYGVNHMWGTTGIGYNTAKVKEALGTDTIDSWDIFFKPENMEKLSKCGVYVLDSPTDVLPAVLNYLKLSPDTNSPADLAKAEELMLKVRPYIRKFHSSEYINALANGDICMAVGYSGDLLQARNRAKDAKQGVEIKYVIPKEGAQLWFDEMVIPADAPHKAEAYEFLNYMMKPDVAARNSNYVFYANGNKASQPSIDKGITGDPNVYPDETMLKKLFLLKPQDPKTLRLWTRTWTKIVTGQ